MGKVLITDTILRDAHQSQAATRMRLEEMLPVADKLDKIGYYSLECWGGATFDSCMRFLNEDPWERLRTLKKAMPKTPLQMLLRGQNLLGYKHYADDVVAEFCKKSIENGIDVVRIFDALNDPRNMETAMKFVKEYGGKAEQNGDKAFELLHFRLSFHQISSHAEASASEGIRQSPRGERLTEPTFGPSGMQERLNCWEKNLFKKSLSHFSSCSRLYTPSNARQAMNMSLSGEAPKRWK